MNREQLLAMINMAPTKQDSSEPLEIRDVEESSSTSPLSEQVLVLDLWDHAKGQEMSEKHSDKIQLSEGEWSDFHAAAFQQQPQLEENCSEKRRHEFVSQLLSTPDYNILHQSTMANELASEMASFQFGQKFSALVKKDAKRKPPKPGDKKGKEKAEMRAEMDLCSSVAQATREAQKEVDELSDMQHALGCGEGMKDSSKMDSSKVAGLFQRVRNSGLLKRICELAGRYRRFAQAKQRQKVQHGYDDMIGVCLDDTIERLLEEEIVQLLDSDLELDALRRLSEKEMLAHEYRGVEKVGKGPIIVCVDESGSMSGEPVANAKAIGLSLYWIARHQKRWCVLVGFSDGKRGTRLILPPNKHKEGELVDWLEHFFGGGTSHHTICEEVPSWWNEFITSGMTDGKTDMVVISDGIINIPLQAEKEFLNWKKKSKCRGILLQLGKQQNGMETIMDENFHLQSLSLNEPGVEKILSI